MAIFRLRRDVQPYLPLTMLDEDDTSWRLLREPRPLLKTWQPLSLRFVTEEEHDCDPPKGYARDSDCPWVLGALLMVMSERAKGAVDDLVSPYVEWLPLIVEGRPYFAMHVLNRLDALDVERSDVKWFEAGGIMKVEHFVFKRDVVEGECVFTMDEPSPFDIFVNEQIVNRINESSLKGFEFIRVWDDAETA